MNLNQKLALIYASRWSALCKALIENGLCDYQHNPLLLNINDPDDFEKADIKVMLFGQDMSSGDWYQYDRKNVFNKENGSILSEIKTFNNTLGAIYDGKRQTRGMGGGMNLFISRLNEKFKGKQIRYVWNDIAKLGRDTTKDWGMKNDAGKLWNIEMNYFDVVKSEIQIIEPQIVVFFTGPTPYWESKLQQKLGITQVNYKSIQNWNNLGQVALLELNKERFPSVQYAFRTYHPCARASKKARYDAIIENIKL
jgi:hypothetical protein